MNLENLETRPASSRKLYTGIVPIKIIAVNPTVKEIATILEKEVSEIKEPNYFLENATRLEFWYTNHDSIQTKFSGKFSLFIGDEHRVSQSGKFMFMDANTNTCWVTSQAEIKDFNSRREHSKVDHVTARKTYKGEDEVYSLLKAYANVDTRKNPFVLDNFLALVKGNVKELSDYFAHFNKTSDQAGVKVLLGVKDGQYQDVWDKVFLPLNSRVTDYITRKIEDENYGYRHFFNNSMTFQEFDPSVGNSNTEEPEWATSEAANVFEDNTTDPFSDTPVMGSPETPTTDGVTTPSSTAGEESDLFAF